MDAFLLVYLISAITIADSLDRTECLAYLAAYALTTNEVNLGSFSDVSFGRLGFSGFACSH